MFGGPDGGGEDRRWLWRVGIAGSAVTNTALQVGQITVAGSVVFGLDWPADWAALVTGEGVVDNAAALGVLGVWTALGCVLAVRGFSWDARRD